MSITIVSTQSKPVQTAPAGDSTANSSFSSDAALAVQDFASLLLEQLVSIPTDGLPSAATKTESTENKESQEANGASLLGDSTNLFAALGIVPVEAKPAVQAELASASTLPAVTSGDSAVPTIVASHQALPAPSNPDDSIADKLKALQTLATQTGRETTSESTVTTQPASQPSPTSDQPAKFAVPASVVSETATLVINKAVEAPATASANITPEITNVAVQNGVPTYHDAQLSIPTPVRDQSWTNDFSQKVVWLASNDKQSAQITLNPPQMGPIEVSITMDKGSASASFVSANAEVRDSIETALPRLREMFASAGIELGQTNVSAESFKQQANNEQLKSATPRWANDNAILVNNASASLSAGAFLSQRGNGLVDIFA